MEDLFTKDVMPVHGLESIGIPMNLFYKNGTKIMNVYEYQEIAEAPDLGFVL